MFTERLADRCLWLQMNEDPELPDPTASRPQGPLPWLLFGAVAQTLQETAQFYRNIELCFLSQTHHR